MAVKTKYRDVIGVSLYDTINRSLENLGKDGMTKSEKDDHFVRTLGSYIHRHSAVDKMIVEYLHENVFEYTSFQNTISDQLSYVNPDTGKPSPLVNDRYARFVMDNIEVIENTIDHSRDKDLSYFGISTMSRGYMKPYETPQCVFMRVACAIHIGDIDAAMKCYNDISNKMYTYATPTLFNAGTDLQQMSSCFLLNMKEDSIDGIYDTLKQTAKISKNAGGIGLAISGVRSKGSYINGTGGTSNGIIPMLRVFNDSSRYIDQGGGKRKGSIAVYLEPWHPEVYEFLDLRKNTGKDEMRARDLFTAMWIPDLFMKRVKEDGVWSLFCPNKCPGLQDSYGDKFEELYLKYENEGLYDRQVSAQDLYKKMCVSQIETGTPYMLYKDHANRKSNQNNIGTIKSSNLCTEIIEYTDENEVAVCNLASMSLPAYVVDDEFDYATLHDKVFEVTCGLNKVIDLNYYPIDEARNSNSKHRPIGIGVQGMADVFMMLGISYESDEASMMNEMIFETIYNAAMEASVYCAINYGVWEYTHHKVSNPDAVLESLPSQYDDKYSIGDIINVNGSTYVKQSGCYKSFNGSPLSKGKYQFDLWGEKPTTNRYDWEGLMKRIQSHGVSNSLLIAPMPTASTSQIMGNYESFEPASSNLFIRRTLTGSFIQINKHLVKDLSELGLWNDDMAENLRLNDGSVQNLDVPSHTKEIYKTVWEVNNKTYVNMAVRRGKYICQSQSMNVYMQSPTVKKLSSLHMYTWSKGLKTGSYYIRSRGASDAIKFTSSKSAESSNSSAPSMTVTCTDEICTVCSA